MSQSASELFRKSCGATVPLELKVSGPGRAGGERRVFEQPFVLAGRHEQTSLRLEDAAVSRRHVYLQQFGERVFCVDLGSRSGIRWGGTARAAGWLRPEQGIQIGPFTLELAMPACGGEGPSDELAEEWDPLQDRVKDPQLLPQITVEGDDKVLAQMRMNRILVLVGSSPACRIRLREPGIANYHCGLVSTPEGVWVVDLLSDTGTCLDGQPVRWALVQEGGQLQVGPYALRFSYPNVATAPPPCRVAEARAEPLATEVSSQVPALQAELNQVREQLRETETLGQQFADIQAECVQLRDQVRTLEDQLAEATGLQGRLEVAEANARQLEIVCAERDQWQAEAQTLQTKIASELTEREGLQQRFEATQQQLGEARETALQQLQETQDGLARSQETMVALQAELNQVREQTRDTEALRQQLAESQAECVRLRDQASTLEIQVADMAGLQARLQTLEASARQLETACAERDHWHTEAQTLHTRLTAEETEKEQWQQRFEAAQQQFGEEREAALQRLQETQSELARSQETMVALQAELNQVREQTRDTEALRQQLAESQAECVRLRDQASAHENRLADAAALQARLEVAEGSGRQLEMVCAERDRWQTEAHTLHTRLTAEEAERGQWQQRLEAAQRQLGEERKAALQRLQEMQQELARSHEEMSALQEVLNQVCEQTSSLQGQVADRAELQARLEVAEASARQLEMVCAERDQWRTESQNLQTRLASDSAKPDQPDGLAAELHAIREERDRLLKEQQASLHLAEQARARVSELEQALIEATEAHVKAVAESRAHGESERQALQARLEHERQTQFGTAQTALRDVQARAEGAIREVQARATTEREAWQKRLDGAEAQIVWERDLFQEQGDKLRQQVASLQAERDRLAAQFAQAESSPRTGRVSEPTPLVEQAAAVDQLFVEFGRLRMGGNLWGEATRPPSQHHMPDEQGIEDPWAQTDVGMKKTVEHRPAPSTSPAIQANPTEASSASDAGQDASESIETPEAEDLHDPLPEQIDEARQGLLRKVFKFVRGK